MGLAYPELVEKVVIVNAGSASRELQDSEVPGSLYTEEPTREGARQFLQSFRDHHLVTPSNHPLFMDEITDSVIGRIYEVQCRNWEWTNARDEQIQRSAETLNEALSYDGKHITDAVSDLDQPALVTWSTRPYEGWPRRTGEPADDSAKKLVTVTPDTLDAYKRDEGFDMGVRLFERISNAELHLWHDADHHVMTDQAEGWTDVVAGFVTR